MYRVPERLGRITFAAVTLVLLAQPGRAQPQTWQLTAQPLLILGADDSPQTEFHRIAGVLRLDNGILAVANGGTNEIRVFSPGGQLLRTIGRSGSGPGEFRNLILLGRAADTLLIADHINSRITRYLIDGTLLGTVRILARDPRRFLVVGHLPTGRWLVETFAAPSIYGPQQVFRDTTYLGLMDADAEGRIRWLGAFPGMTFFRYNPANEDHGQSVGVVPVGPTTTFAIVAGRVLVADTDRPLITVFTEDGSIAREVALALRPVPLTENEVAPLRAARLQEAKGDWMRTYLTTLFSRTLPRTTPLHAGMVASSDQQIWVVPYVIGVRTRNSFLVLDRSGRPVATVPAPAGFRLYEVGHDYVLGVHTDEDGVERVQLYGLFKRP
jgi:hypothetical protein